MPEITGKDFGVGEGRMPILKSNGFIAPEMAKRICAVPAYFCVYCPFESEPKIIS